jgi:hypothetical protein
MWAINTDGLKTPAAMPGSLLALRPVEEEARTVTLRIDGGGVER